MKQLQQVESGVDMGSSVNNSISVLQIRNKLFVKIWILMTVTVKGVNLIKKPN